MIFYRGYSDNFEGKRDRSYGWMENVHESESSLMYYVPISNLPYYNPNPENDA